MDAEEYDSRTDLDGIISKKNFEFVQAVNQSTLGVLGDAWINNVKANKKFWRKHLKIRDLVGIGKNKAVIGVGAGASFNKNKDVLKDYVNRDGVKPWEDRNFITIASNHQFKPLLDMGIIPDFVIVVDASDVILDQLTKDIPSEAQGTQLITGVHSNPKVIKKWDKQGRGIVFYASTAPLIQEAAKKHIKRGLDENVIELGGNVMNGAFMIGAGPMKSSVFMGVGNDLSFPMSKDAEKQRKEYYADGDYSTNAEVTGTGRDEGKSMKRWHGLSLERKRIISIDEPIGSLRRYNINLDIVGTSYTLWVYKIWLETAMIGQTNIPVYLHYFNCTEGGILGVMAKEDDDKSLFKEDNWYLLDEVCINKHTGKQMYMTAMLEDAFDIFLKTKRSQTWHVPVAQPATALVALN